MQKSNPRMWHREIQNLVNLRKSDLALNIEGIDSGRHDLIANQINDHFVGFSQSQKCINLEELPAYLPSSSCPSQIYPWETFKELRNISAYKSKNFLTIYLLGFCKNLL